MSALLPSAPVLPSVSSVRSSGVPAGLGASVPGFLRPSRRSLSGFVFVAAAGPGAPALARFWAPRLPAVCQGVVVRAGGLVSVPVSL